MSLESMEEIIQYMLGRKMTLRKYLLWLGVIPWVGISWLILGIVWKAYEIATCFAEHAECLIRIMVK